MSTHDGADREVAPATVLSVIARQDNAFSIGWDDPEHQRILFANWLPIAYNHIA